MKRRSKKYSILYLLSKQPEKIRKDSHFPLMMDYYRSSDILKKIRFGRRCYSLLNKAKIKPEYLNNFYRTYRLPKNPFFPLFFSIKTKYFEKKRQRKLEKEKYILFRMRSLPENITRTIKFMAEFEKRNNPRGKCPLWFSRLFPKTKKQTDIFCKYSQPEWFFFFETYLRLLKKNYGKINVSSVTRIMSCFLLDCLSEKNAESNPDIAAIKRKYRILSKKYHPDTGGDPEYFLKIRHARDVLLNL